MSPPKPSVFLFFSVLVGCKVDDVCLQTPSIWELLSIGWFGFSNMFLFDPCHLGVAISNGQVVLPALVKLYITSRNT